MPSQSPSISPPPLKRRRTSPPPQVHCLSKTQSSPIHSRPTAASLRIYSWNINGITPFLPTSTPQITRFLTPKTPSESRESSQTAQPSLRANLRRWDWPHVLCLQEVKIAPNDTKTLSAVRRAVNSPLDSDDEGGDDGTRPLYDAHFCLPRDRYNARGFGGKVYGVCTLVRRALRDVRFKEVDWDQEGRVLLAEIPSREIVIINVYGVNGTTNDYRDPESGKVIGKRHDRKRQFHSLLRDEVRRYEVMGWAVVLVGDINISRAVIDSFPQLRMGSDHVKNRADFEEKFMGELRMLDIFRAVRGQERKYTYRPRNKPWGAGGDRVDLILVSKGTKVTEVDVLDSEEERGPSDHVPLFAEVDISDRDRHREGKPPDNEERS